MINLFSQPKMFLMIDKSDDIFYVNMRYQNITLTETFETNTVPIFNLLQNLSHSFCSIMLNLRPDRE